MINTVLAKVFGTKHERDIKRMQPQVAAINDLEPSLKKLSDDELAARTVTFREQLDQGASLDDLLIPAFATVREVAMRTLGMRHYDVQLMGAMVLHRGRIAEMKTGEGKTLMSTLASYLNALSGNAVHMVTVNDYLAARDREWMSPIFDRLGIATGAIQTNMDERLRREAYAADITYGTNNEFGFDYLRDNMKLDLSSMVQRGHSFAIIDEIDSILIDEARTPLIISGPSEDSTEKYVEINRIIPKFVRGEEHEDEYGNKSTTGDFLIDEKAQTVSLTDEGVAKAEKLLRIENLYDMEHIERLHGINQGLRAHHLFKRDVDYLIKDGQVVIVDEFTGRMMPGRRWSDGLHQAVEAKEGVRIERENQTLATITFQNYFRMYDKLSGMTGTAETEENEFGEIYELEVSVIPTNRPMVRADNPDLVYRTARERWDAVVEDIRHAHDNGQPVLVGTVSIESSEKLSKFLKKAKVRHHVLNAKYHSQEAEIIAQAGRKGAVTIATNMAGRGTDIVLGGNPEGLAAREAAPEKEPEAYAEALERAKASCAQEKTEVLDAGGLHIIGTERHESRRIDNQLRGRSGRQGDPGSSRFFLSLEDDLMRIFGTDRISGMMEKLGMEEGMAIENKLITRAIERAQNQVEGRNFETRKHLLKYDDVMNKQREAIYELRCEILEGGESTRAYAMRLCDDIVDDAIERHCPPQADPRDWELDALSLDMRNQFTLDAREAAGRPLDELGLEELRDALKKAVVAKYEAKEKRIGEDVMRAIERSIMLQVVDNAWKEHLLMLDHLKEGIHLRAQGQRDPLNEYKRESFELFERMKTQLEDKITSDIFRVEPITEEELAQRRARLEALRRQFELSAPPKQQAGPARPAAAPVMRSGIKIGRNDPCPCGSGKKYKKCCGTPQAMQA